MIKDSLMRKMNKEMKELKAKKPVKENKQDLRQGYYTLK